MEEHQDINNRLDELFAKARTDKPVMGVDEVRGLIGTVATGSASNTGKTAKSNIALYMLVGGIVLIAITAGSWFYLNTDANSNATVSTTTEAPKENSQNTVTTNSNIENAPSDVLNTSDNNIADNKEETTVAVNNESDISGKPVTAEKADTKPVTTEIIKPAPNVPASSNNKTYIVSGGDFEVNFKTDDEAVKMKLKEEDVKELSINGKIIPNSEYPKYKDIIEQGKKMMAAEKAKNVTSSTSTKSSEEQKRDETNTRLFNAFTAQLTKDKLINEDKYSFKLTSKELIIDEKIQPETVHQKYLELFKSTAGRDIGGSVFKFNHGMD